jgi:hypothetical protein
VTVLSWPSQRLGQCPPHRSVLGIALEDLLARRFASFRTIYLPTAAGLRERGFELLATGQRPHYTVQLRRADDPELEELLAALGATRPNPSTAEAASDERRADMYRVDMTADLNDEDQTGYLGRSWMRLVTLRRSRQVLWSWPVMTTRPRCARSLTLCQPVTARSFICGCYQGWWMTTAPWSTGHSPASSGRASLEPLWLVGMAGFEPAASCSQSRRANQAALHPVCCAHVPGPAARLEGRRAQVYGKAPGRPPAHGIARPFFGLRPSAQSSCLCGQLSASGRSPGPVSLKPKSSSANSDLPIIGQCNCIQP